jgi:DNA invertase Pin-like site-specific DNA recombinase
MIYGYLRVSTEKQNAEAQKIGILQLADKEDVKVNKWVRETVSGVKGVKQRELGSVIEEMREGDILITSEISRLARSTLAVMEILNCLMDKKCELWTVKESYRLGSDISSTILAFCFSLAAQLERDLISQRTKESLMRKKAEGVKLGRPKGYVVKNKKLSGREDEISNLLKHGVSKRAIARLMGVHHTTVTSFIREKKLD